MTDDSARRAQGRERGRRYRAQVGAARVTAALRNCVGARHAPGDGDLYCSTNERDGLGDDLVPDFITRVA
jgi:glucose/arabinose dehydrogenase